MTSESDVEACLAYFRQAVRNPAGVPPWSAWWAANAERVERSFPLIDFVRLKHRRLRGARQLLQNRGEVPADLVPPDPLQTGSCAECGERVTRPAAENGYRATCPNCGVIGTDLVRPAGGD